MSERRQGLAGTCQTLPDAIAWHMLRRSGEAFAAAAAGDIGGAALCSVEATLSNICIEPSASSKPVDPVLKRRNSLAWGCQALAQGQTLEQWQETKARLMDDFLDAFARGDEGPSLFSLGPYITLDLVERSSERGGILPNRLALGLLAVARRKLKGDT